MRQILTKIKNKIRKKRAPLKEYLIDKASLESLQQEIKQTYIKAMQKWSNSFSSEDLEEKKKLKKESETLFKKEEELVERYKKLKDQIYRKRYSLEVYTYIEKEIKSS